MAELAIPSSAFPPGYEFDYAQVTTDATSTQTVQASATTIITGASITYDGLTTVFIEWGGLLGNSGGGTTIVNLWEDSTDLKRVGQTITTGTFVANKLRRIPTAGAKVYTIRMWVTGNTGTIFGATGSPGFLVVNKA